MKSQRLVIISAFFAIILSGATNAKKVQYVFVASDSSSYAKMCIEAGENDLTKLKRTLPLHRSEKRDIINNLSCNNLPINHFAVKYGAQNTALYLNKLANRKNRIKNIEVTITDLADNNIKNTNKDDKNVIIKTVIITSN